jgi:perosamine synthetase
MSAFHPRIGERERELINQVLDTQFRGSLSGKVIRRLEETFAKKIGCRYAVSFANGTATLHAALLAAGVGPGDEVIVPPLTMASTSFAVLHAGALPVFADVDPATWTISPSAVERLITPRTRAVIPVSLYGLSPDIDAIMDIAGRKSLFVLEDDAQCFLGSVHGRIVGSIAHAASFSFQNSKHVTCGEGGMVTTNDEAFATRLRRFNSLGYAGVGAGEGKISKDTIQDPDYVRHIQTGWNYRLSELCAAVALAHVERLEDLVETRRAVARLFEQAREGCRWLVPQSVPAGCSHSYWTYALKLDNNGAFGWRDFRRKFRELGGDGIYAAWRLTYLEPAFQSKKLNPDQTQILEPGLCPVAESLQPRLLQFRTNYFERDRAERQAEILRRTIAHFGL